MSSKISTGKSTSSASMTKEMTMKATTVSSMTLPTERIELTPAVHEEIRKERVEEIQPIVNVEKFQTEFIQKTQPILDREIKSVNLQKQVLDTEVLPEINLPGKGMAVAKETSTVHFQNTASMVVEKPAIVSEIDKLKIVEEIQPVIYKETVVPEVIKETKPMYQKVVEGNVYVQETLPTVALPSTTVERTPFVSQSNFQSTTASMTLPTERVELPAAVHEEIRKERVEEIQPMINIEKLKTNVIQSTQPILDKEVKPVVFQSKTLAAEVLPEISLPGKGHAAMREISTVDIKETAALLVEKPAVYNEVDKLQVIEEIQPVIYKETIVPELIKETKPMYQKVVEGNVYSQQVLPTRVLESTKQSFAYVPSGVEVKSTMESMTLPTERVELPAAIHEEIRNERVEELQSVINIEKLKTEVVQITQPILDKEIKPVLVQEKLLETEILPSITLPGSGSAMVREFNTIDYKETSGMVVERPAVYNEVDKLRIIEEIQPVIYKETIVPTVVQQTKPVYQKIVEGPVYTHKVLPPVQLHGSHFSYPATTTFVQTKEVITPVVECVRTTEVKPLVLPVPVCHPHHEKKIIEEITTTTTTTTATSCPNATVRKN